MICRLLREKKKEVDPIIKIMMRICNLLRIIRKIRGYQKSRAGLLVLLRTHRCCFDQYEDVVVSSGRQLDSHYLIQSPSFLSSTHKP